MQILDGQKGDFTYNVTFASGKLISKVADPKLGVENMTTVDGTLVVDALIDLIEKAIPGDQTAQAAWLKDVANKALAKQAEQAAPSLDAAASATAMASPKV